MSVCEFCPHAKKIEGHIYCKEHNNTDVTILNITHCKNAYQAPSKEEPMEPDSKALKREDLKAGDIVFGCSRYCSLQVFVIAYVEYCSHIIAVPVFPFDESARRIDDEGWTIFSNAEDVIAYYKKKRSAEIEKERQDSLKTIEQKIEWFQAGVKEKRWDKTPEVKG